MTLQLVYGMEMSKERVCPEHDHGSVAGFRLLCRSDMWDPAPLAEPVEWEVART